MEEQSWGEGMRKEEWIREMPGNRQQLDKGCALHIREHRKSFFTYIYTYMENISFFFFITLIKPFRNICKCLKTKIFIYIYI